MANPNELVQLRGDSLNSPDASAQKENQSAVADSVQSIAANQPDTLATQAKAITKPVVPANNYPRKPKRLARKSDSGLMQMLNKKNLLGLADRLVKFGVNHLPLSIRKFWGHAIEKLYAYPLTIFLILLIFVFILNIILVFLILYLTNQYKNKKERYTRIYSHIYERALQSFLFGETDWPQTRLKLKGIDKSLNRRILTDVLFNYQENLRGEMDSKIAEIFLQLGFHKDAAKMARSLFFHRKIRGLSELTNLYPEGAKPIVDKAINDSSDLVRGEAQTSYIRLHADAPFDFFRTLTRPFTRWTQLSAFYLFRLHQLPVPQFADYLNSTHTNVRNFSLRMIIFFQQLENAPAIFNMLGSTTEMTRNLSIQAINDLRLFEGKELIKEKYSDESSKNRLEIIRALRNIGNSDDFDFLKSILTSGTISEKIEACRTMYFMSTESREQLSQLNQEMNRKFDLYLAHVTELRN